MCLKRILIPILKCQPAMKTKQIKYLGLGPFSPKSSIYGENRMEWLEEKQDEMVTKDIISTPFSRFLQWVKKNPTDLGCTFDQKTTTISSIYIGISFWYKFVSIVENKKYGRSFFFFCWWRRNQAIKQIFFLGALVIFPWLIFDFRFDGGFCGEFFFDSLGRGQRIRFFSRRQGLICVAFGDHNDFLFSFLLFDGRHISDFFFFGDDASDSANSFGSAFSEDQTWSFSHIFRPIQKSESNFSFVSCSQILSI